MYRINWKNKKGEIDDKIIQEFENKFGVEFPKDYIECVRYNQGALPEPCFFKVNEKERIFGELLSFEINSKGNIYNTYTRIREGLPKKVIPFATDPSGNFICFDYVDGETEPKIVFWYHEISVAEDDLDEEELENNMLDELQREAIVYICDSFTDLMNMLY